MPAFFLASTKYNYYMSLNSLQFLEKNAHLIKKAWVPGQPIGYGTNTAGGRASTSYYNRNNEKQRAQQVRNVEWDKRREELSKILLNKHPYEVDKLLRTKYGYESTHDINRNASRKFYQREGDYGFFDKQIRDDAQYNALLKDLQGISDVQSEGEGENRLEYITLQDKDGNTYKQKVYRDPKTNRLLSAKEQADMAYRDYAAATAGTMGQRELLAVQQRYPWIKNTFAKSYNPHTGEYTDQDLSKNLVSLELSTLTPEGKDSLARYAAEQSTRGIKDPTLRQQQYDQIYQQRLKSYGVNDLDMQEDFKNWWSANKVKPVEKQIAALEATYGDVVTPVKNAWMDTSSWLGVRGTRPSRFTRTAVEESGIAPGERRFNPASYINDPLTEAGEYINRAIVDVPTKGIEYAMRLKYGDQKAPDGRPMAQVAAENYQIPLMMAGMVTPGLQPFFTAGHTATLPGQLASNMMFDPANYVVDQYDRYKNNERYTGSKFSLGDVNNELQITSPDFGVNQHWDPENPDSGPITLPYNTTYAHDAKGNIKLDDKGRPVLNDVRWLPNTLLPFIGGQSSAVDDANVDVTGSANNAYLNVGGPILTDAIASFPILKAGQEGWQLAKLMRQGGKGITNAQVAALKSPTLGQTVKELVKRPMSSTVAKQTAPELKVMQTIAKNKRIPISQVANMSDAQEAKQLVNMAGRRMFHLPFRNMMTMQSLSNVSPTSNMSSVSSEMHTPVLTDTQKEQAQQLAQVIEKNKKEQKRQEGFNIGQSIQDHPGLWAGGGALGILALMGLLGGNSLSGLFGGDEQQQGKSDALDYFYGY